MYVRRISCYDIRPYFLSPALMKEWFKRFSSALSQEDYRKTYQEAKKENLPQEPEPPEDISRSDNIIGL